MATTGTGEHRWSVKQRGVCVAIVLLAAGTWCTAWAIRPDPHGYGTHERLGLAPCAFRALTGLPCPTCGLTTSVCHLVRGQWREAMQAHPAGPLVLLMGIVVGTGLCALAVGGYNAATRRACVQGAFGLGVLSASVAVLWWFWQLAVRLAW